MPDTFLKNKANVSTALVTFTAKLWLYNTEKAAWHFITLPNAAGDKIRFFTAQDMPAHRRSRGFGSVKVAATIGATSWRTSVFPYKEGDINSYILPVKREVREKTGLGEGDMAEVSLSLIDMP